MAMGRFSARDFLTTILLIVGGGVTYTLVKPKLRSLKVPVIIYIIVISVMVGRAVSTLAGPVFNRGQALMIILGATLFYVSDVLLALNRFWKPWRYNRISLVFYYCGQLLIALAAAYFS